MTGYGQFSIDSFVESYLQDLKSAIDSITSDDIDGLVSRVLHSRSCGASIHFIGNGGSFADAQHLTAEFVSKLRLERSPLPALALGTNSSNLSAIS